MRKQLWDATVFIHQELSVIPLDSLNPFKAFFMHLEHDFFQVKYIYLTQGNIFGLYDLILSPFCVLSLLKLGPLLTISECDI